MNSSWLHGYKPTHEFRWVRLKLIHGLQTSSNTIIELRNNEPGHCFDCVTVGKLWMMLAQAWSI